MNPAPRASSRDAVHRALDELHRLTSSRRSYARLMESAGVELTRTSADVLAHVCASGPLSMGALAHALHHDPGACARYVAGLEDAGLLQRERSTQDGRVSIVHATPAGHAVNTRVQRAETEQLEQALAALDDDELETCAATLEQLIGFLHGLNDPVVSR